MLMSADRNPRWLQITRLTTSNGFQFQVALLRGRRRTSHVLQTPEPTRIQLTTPDFLSVCLAKSSSIPVLTDTSSVCKPRDTNTSKGSIRTLPANTTLPSPTTSTEEQEVKADDVEAVQSLTTNTSNNSDISVSSQSSAPDVVTTMSDLSTSPHPTSTVSETESSDSTWSRSSLGATGSLPVSEAMPQVVTFPDVASDTGNPANTPSQSGVGLTGGTTGVTDNHQKTKVGSTGEPANSTDQPQTAAEVTGMPANSTGQQADRGQQVTTPRAVAYQASLEELLVEGRARYALSDDTKEEEEVKVEEEFLCPNESGFFRHPTNCSRFYWCNHFIPTAMLCAPHTAFDPETHVCSWAVGPDGCGAQLPLVKHTHDPHPRHGAVLTTTQPAASSDTQSQGRQVRSGRQPRQVSPGHYNSRDAATSSTDGEDSKTSEGKSFGLNSRGVDFNAGRDHFQCPGDGFYADPNDCTYFYHCSIGKAFKFQCQNGTAFNRDKFVCSWPVGEDGCGGMLSVPYRQVLEEELGLSTNHVNSNFRCPQPEGFYPDAQNCSIFYHCVKSKPYHHECGSGTVYSTTKGVCVWPDSDDDDNNGKKCGDSSVLGESYRAALDNNQPRDQQGGASSQRAPLDKHDHRQVNGDHHAVEDGEEDVLHHDDHHSHSELSEVSSNVESDKYNQQPDRKERTVEPATTPAEGGSGPTEVSTRSAIEGATLQAQSVQDFSQVASSWPWGNTDKKVAASSQGTSTDTTFTVSTAATTFATGTTSTPRHVPSTTDTTSTPPPAQKTTLKAELYRVIGLETDFRCPKPAGHFRDPRNCAVYYHCADAVAYRLDCPEGQLYDVRQYQCLPIPQVKDCVRVDKDQVDDWEERWLGTYPEVDSYPKQKDFLESFECEESSGFHGNPQDCSSYVECIDGVPYARKCMSGTVFDDGRKKCTWSSLVPACNTGSRAPDELRM
ncbi:hypothetical protein C0Q70_06587 [Pomacea canaliculata]|uniref:Chitin-binding type-2 domain-containing protein n=1 Tax=Pomacea canaliculata TaxID=400727 RepID=A0A2T7PCN9_POMCA|nr:hypothetical protein C0Q70_06587 [Pomacea canaliculata]